MKQKETFEDIESLIEKIESYNPNADISLIKKAYEFAKEAHKNQKREDNTSYIEHPFGIAKILADLRSDSVTIASALLHDTLEDTNVTLKYLQKNFGNEIASLVEGLTKIRNVRFESKDEYKAENLRKILLATAKDIRIILIKLADRLHNMRTLDIFSEEKRRRISRETLDIYAPIANKLGIQKLKGELEDLSLRYLKPDVYDTLRKKINEKREAREKRTKEIIALIEDKLKERSIKAEIHGRAKYFYSIYQKMLRDSKDFNEIYDLIAIRIILKTIPECYASLGIVHNIWKPMPGRFKDYISVPKANGYQSLHTSVITDEGKILEFQIRTEEMHLNAEDGVAAHWMYKGTDRDKAFDKKINWLKHLLDWKTSESAKDFIETFKFDLFQNEIVVFTPKGDPISLPEGSTPIDFAYEVHSFLGDSCSKAEVNKVIVPLDYKLKSGEIIHIITSPKTSPSRQWLKFVKTGKAKSLIRQKLGIESFKKDYEEVTENISKYIKSDKKAPIKLSQCCSPKLKEPIRGFLKKDKTISIHKTDCPNISSLDKKKEVKVYWDVKEKTSSKITIVVKDRLGLISELLTSISKHAPLLSINSKQSHDRLILNLEVSTKDKIILEEIVKEIKKTTNLISYEFN